MNEKWQRSGGLLFSRGILPRVCLISGSVNMCVGRTPLLSAGSSSHAMGWRFMPLTCFLSNACVCFVACLYPCAVPWLSPLSIPCPIAYPYPCDVPCLSFLSIPCPIAYPYPYAVPCLSPLSIPCPIAYPYPCAVPCLSPLSILCPIANYSSSVSTKCEKYINTCW